MDSSEARRSSSAVPSATGAGEADREGRAARSRTRLPTLTGLRYLAAAGVVVFHAAPVLAPGTWFDKLSTAGSGGVTFFFVLSGFVLAWTTQGSAPVGPATFYRRRFARVYPLHVVTWAAAAVFSAVSGDHKTALSLLLSLLLLQAWAPREAIYYGGNTPSWSLSCEAFFYALFPLLVRAPFKLTQRSRWLVPALLAVFLGEIAYGVSDSYTNWLGFIFPVTRLGEFLVGILLAAAMRGGMRVPLPIWAATSVLVIVYLISGTLLSRSPRGLVDAVLLPAFVLLLASAATSDLMGRRSFWARPLVVKLGEWSFALYLVHYMMARLLARVLNGHSGGPILGPVAVLLFLAIATAVSFLAHRLVEQPLEKRIRGRKSGAAESSLLRGEPL